MKTKPTRNGFTVSYDIIAKEDLVDNSIVVYTAAVAVGVGGPAIARRPSLHTRGRGPPCPLMMPPVTRPLFYLCLSAVRVFYSSVDAFGAYGIEIGRPPRPETK